MSAPDSENRQYVLRLWLPALAGAAVLGILFVAALTSGDPQRAVPVVVGISAAVVLIVVIRWQQKRRIGRMFQAADPSPFLRSFETSTRRIPHGAHFAAANSATILALYGRGEEAVRILESVSWQDVPPLVQAQASLARAAIAYAKGAAEEGLDHAVTATQQAAVTSAAPGARTSELAFRTYRNLGLALAGRATPATAQELRDARGQLPLVGQVLAAWGLAAIAARTNDGAQLQEMRQFLRTNAPHLRPVLESVDGGDR